MKYIVVSSFSIDSLQKQVNEKIENGYIPCGGISVLSGKFKDSAGGLYQAMISEKMSRREIYNKHKIETFEKKLNYSKDIANTENTERELFFCPDCGCIVEEYQIGVYACGNEDCDFQTYDKNILYKAVV